ncbi:YqaJ viral recombinase family protein [Solilutibacter silvestris]|uniref:YqaJ viral recombinase family protein n=1 Tax=Solilutibacter silvestris TaxID=1645665 RepID=UPI003D324EDB
MKIIDLQQGSAEWLAHRRTTRNASDASVMMAESSNLSRREFVRLQAVGLEREFSDYVQKRILDRGHEVEPALRLLAEEKIGEELYPVTAVSDDGYLGASFDGVTMAEDVIFEAKQSNAEKMESVRSGIIPASDRWQIVQQFAVCDAAQRCYYFVGDGAREGTVHMCILRSDVADDIVTLRSAWAQFDADVAAFQPEPEVLPAPTGRTPDQLPALRVEVTGMVTASNLAEWKDAAIAVFQGINTDLQTDQDFADAEKTVKWCGDIEDQLKAAKQHALSQTQSIDELFRTIDAISAEARAKRLDLDKLVKARKESIRAEIVSTGAAAVRAHYDAINATLGAHAFQPPQTLQMNIGAVIKGKKSIASMRDAVDAAVAAQKIEASQQAERVRANMAILAESPDHASLFADRVQLCATKQPEDLKNMVAARISEHDQREAARLEAEREHIRKEEAERIQREQQDAVAEQAAPKDTTPAAVVSTIAQPMTARPSTPGSADRPGTRIKLGDINARIAPLSITAEGLAQLGFRPVDSAGPAKLYFEKDFNEICSRLVDVISHAQTMTKAA